MSLEEFRRELFTKTRKYAKELNAIIMGSIALAHQVKGYNFYKDGDLLAKKCRGDYLSTVKFGDWIVDVTRLMRELHVQNAQTNTSIC